MFTKSCRLLVLALAALVSHGGTAQQSPPKAGELQVKRGVFRSASGVEVTAEYGTLAVPENRANPKSKVIQIAFGRLISRAKNPAAPLVFLAGGPGDGATHQATDPEALERWLPVLRVCDVILLDQRGSGRSRPTLRWAWDGPLPPDLLVSEEAAKKHWRAMSQRARADLVKRGMDLDGYTTVQSANDIDDLRRALKSEKVSLMGFSYGTHWALASARRHGEHLESVVLVGVAGPDHLMRLPLAADAHLRRLSALAACDERVGVAVSDMVGLLQRVLQKLEAKPVIVRVADPRTKEPVDLAVGRFGLCWLLARDLGDTSDVSVFPRLLHSLDQGDSRILRWFVQKRLPFFLQVDGLMMLVRGASGATPGRLAEIRAQAGKSLFGNAMNFPFSEADVWAPPDLGEEYRAPVRSDVRTLLISGSLDWNTPPAQAEEVRRGLAKATHVVVENVGHEQTLRHPKVRAAIVDFLTGKDLGGLRVEDPPLRFVPIKGNDPAVSHPAVPGE